MNTRDSLVTNGYVDLGVYHPEKNAIEAAQLIALDLNIKIDRFTDPLTVNSVDAKPKNTYAGNYGLGKLPLHTDLAHWHIPPKFLMLRCVVPDPQVSTLLLHHSEVLAKLPLAVADRALFRPRRRLDGKMFLLRLRNGEIFRWDQLFLTPENKEADQVQSLMSNDYSGFEVMEITLDKPGMTVVIDNWNMLHGRSMVTNESSPRRIERAYFTEDVA
jgi:L-asparagine oxygenase